MNARGWVRVAVLGLLAALPACGSDDEPETASLASPQSADLPARYGLYALQDGRLGRLDGEKSFQIETWDSRSSLRPDVTFIVFDRALGDRSLRLAETIRLRQVARVRNAVAASGLASPLPKDEWVVADLPDFAVALDFQPVPGSPEMVAAIPAGPLSPGLYALQFRQGQSATTGRFGVDWSKVDKDQYATEHCVDRYATTPATYKACTVGAAQAPKQHISQQPLAPQPPQPATQSHTLQQQLVQQQAPQPTAAVQGLQLRDVQAERSSDQDMPILIVQGVVVNTSNAVRRVPPLLATLRDAQGVELDRWTFAAELTELAPGASTGFRTEAVSPTTQSTNLSVMFAAEGTAQAQ